MWGQKGLLVGTSAKGGTAQGGGVNVASSVASAKTAISWRATAAPGQ
jgi:hypothetical protein